MCVMFHIFNQGKASDTHDTQTTRRKKIYFNPPMCDVVGWKVSSLLLSVHDTIKS